MRVDSRLVLCSLFVLVAIPVVGQTPGFQSSGGNTTTSDKVGVGTTTPTTALHVAVETTVWPRGIMVQQSNNGTDSPQLVFRKTRGTILSPQGILQSDGLANISAEAYDGSAYLRTGAHIKFSNDAPIAVGSIPTALVFGTGSSGVGTERMRISSAGNVGIGFQSPTLPLQVVGVAQLNGVARRNVTAFDGSVAGSGVGGGIAFGGSYSAAGATSEFGNIWGIKENSTDNDNASALLFATHGNAGTPLERLRIGSDGLVTVGTLPAPPPNTVKLNVIGDINVTGNINAKYQDVAEWVPASTSMMPGTVVVLDPQTSNQVMPSLSSYDTSVAGVVSGQPGLLLGEPGPLKAKIATTGRVKVRVDASRTPIHIGDLLVTSDERGIAMRSEPMNVNGRKFHQPGTVIGKALEPLGEGKGEILVLLSLQ
jgi:hypothetical protein